MAQERGQTHEAEIGCILLTECLEKSSSSCSVSCKRAEILSRALNSALMIAPLGHGHQDTESSVGKIHRRPHTEPR
jgi:hypothetical protein